jgi:hypothetical protein
MMRPVILLPETQNIDALERALLRAIQASAARDLKVRVLIAQQADLNQAVADAQAAAMASRGRVDTLRKQLESAHTTDDTRDNNPILVRDERITPLDKLPYPRS